MKKGFWNKLPRPFFALAPLADVTDPAFRRLIAKYGKPDVMWTEFVSADGLCSPGRKVLIKDLDYTEGERPIVAQLFSGHPDKMREAAALVEKLGFDGLDINMGCPDRAIEKQGAGAAMIKNPLLAREVIRAAKEGAPSLPISVKTRIGYNKNELDKWLPEILAEGISAVTIHARTRKEMSLVPARWEHVKEAVAIRDRLAPETLIIGNGDVLDLGDAQKKAKETGADGIMLGRAIFGTPWLFASKDDALRFTLHAPRLEIMVEHTKLFEKYCAHKNFSVMKKHYKAYVKGSDARPTERSFGRGAKELRVKLMETENAEEVERVVKQFLISNT